LLHNNATRESEIYLSSSAYSWLKKMNDDIWKIPNDKKRKWNGHGNLNI
jgi:hypothetical protein